ncbi:MAG: light-harvesting antenna LH1, beta subunit [Pseudomonadota bacterium]
MSGLTERGAKEYHSLFVGSALIYVVIAVIAHFLVWSWRSWFPGTGGYDAALHDTVNTVATVATTLLG